MATVVDFNADGKSDIASTNPGAYTVSVLLNIADIPMFTLSTRFAGEGDGSVTINPGGILCTTNCSKSYANRTEVSLSAKAKVGSIFSGWSGAGCSRDGICSLTLTSDQEVTATFDLIPDFAITASAFIPETLSPGQSASSTVDVRSIGGFSNDVGLTCSVSPKPPLAPQCSISPNSLNPGASATLTVTTTGPTIGSIEHSASHVLLYAMAVPLLGVTLTGIRSRKRGNRTLLFLLFCLSVVALQVACGGHDGIKEKTGTPAGKYTVTLTGSSGPLQHFAIINLTVE